MFFTTVKQCLNKPILYSYTTRTYKQLIVKYDKNNYALFIVTKNQQMTPNGPDEIVHFFTNATFVHEAIDLQINRRKDPNDPLVQEFLAANIAVISMQELQQYKAQIKELKHKQAVQEVEF